MGGETSRSGGFLHDFFLFEFSNGAFSRGDRNSNDVTIVGDGVEFSTNDKQNDRHGRIEGKVEERERQSRGSLLQGDAYVS